MSFAFKADDYINGDDELLPDNTQVRLAIRDARRKKNPATGTVSLNLNFAVVEGQYKKHRFDYRITMECSNPKAVTIGKQQLARICKAAGVEGFDDEDELVGCQFNAIAKIRPARGEYRASQEIAPVLSQVQQAKAALPKPAQEVPAVQEPIVEEGEDDIAF
jgi:hypothetical protein